MAKRAQKLYRCIWVLCAITLSGCKHRAQVISDSEQASIYLNERQYQKAIPLLKKMRANEPTNDRYRVQLASAYVGSVGFNFVDSLKAFEALMKKDSLAGLRLVGIDDMVDEVISLAVNLKTILTALRTFPYIAVEERYRLREASELLGEVDKASPEVVRARTYRIVIALLSLLNIVRDASGIAAPESLSERDFLCKMKFGVIFSELPALVAEVNEASFALAEIAPKIPKWKPEKISEVQEKLAAVDKRLDSFETELEVSELVLTVQSAMSCAGQNTIDDD